jgi:hypothetical protein
MPQITNAGTYRGKVLEHAVNESTNGFPQLVAKMSGLEYYDETTKEWCILDDAPEATAYLILVDSKGEKTLNCTQIEKVFGWDATSLEELENMPLEEKPIQFRAAFRKYDDKDKLGVEWIDDFDAVPGRIVKKLDAAEIKTLQSKYSGVFTGKKTAPVSAVKPPPQVPGKAPVKSPVVPGKLAGPKTVTKPQIPARKPTAPRIETPAGTCTQQEAFDFVSNKELWKKDVTDQRLAETWIRIVTEIAGTRPDTEVTPAEWYTIKDKVAHEIFVF